MLTVACVWLAVSVSVGVVTGRMIRHRDTET